MIHLGDITRIDGRAVPPVDVVTGGSPCQDLSVAGKRAGLAGERSGLYMEQIRIIKEMREEDRRRGRADHLCRPRFMVWENVPGALSSNRGADFGAVLTEAVRVVEPEAPGVPVPEKGWPTSGCLYGELGRWSLAWRIHDGQFWGVPQRRRRIALVCDFGGLAAPEILFERKGVSGDIDQGTAEGDALAPGAGGGAAGTTVAQKFGTGGNNTPLVVAGIDCRNGKETEELLNTLQSGGTGVSLNATHPIRIGKTIRRLTPLECERLQGFPDGWTDIGPWTDSKGKFHKESSDSARYKALGNSIALPFWKWLSKRISALYERDATLGSLFDGIGGFPLCWERVNGPGSCLWASEIEEFPMAVTRYHFGGEAPHGQ